MSKSQKLFKILEQSINKDGKLDPLVMELLGVLNLKREELRDNYLNNIKYYCNYCNKICVGLFYQNKNKNICATCFKMVNVPNNRYKIIINEKYNRQLSYKYSVIAIKKVSATKYLYIIEESNYVENFQDIHYYLKLYSNGDIIIDYELQSYNPYFGIHDIELDIDNNDIVTIKYEEKLSKCIVKLKPTFNSHTVYLKSKPNRFFRAQNNDVKWHEVGDILEFSVDGKIKKNKNYFD